MNSRERLKTFFSSALQIDSNILANASSANIKQINGKIHEHVVKDLLEKAGIYEYKEPSILRTNYSIKLSVGEGKWKLFGLNRKAIKKKFCYIHQPFGSQNKPDFLLFYWQKGKIRFVALECKSSKLHTAMWNDSYPIPNMVYLFSLCSKKEESKQNTTFFLGSEIVSEETERILEEIRLATKKRQLEDNLKIGGSMSVYHRIQFNCSEKHLLVEDRKEREVRALNFMLENLFSDVVEEPLQAMSLFAGAGGDTLGMEKSGYKVVAFCEKRKSAVDTHLQNFPHSRWLMGTNQGDIRKISDKVFTPYTKKIKVLFAGHPCEGFSKAGKKDPKDPRNQLFGEFVRVTKLLSPEWIIGENVPRLLDTSVFSAIEESFKKLGYTMSLPKVLDCSQFGVPQKRKRLLYVASKSGKTIDLPEKNEEKGKTLLECLEYSEKGIEFIEPEWIEVREGVSLTWLEEKKECKKRKQKSKVHPYLKKLITEKKISFGKRKTSSHGVMLNLKENCPTIISYYGSMPRIFVGQKSLTGKYSLRTLTIKELQQIQGFPFEFSFSGSKRDQIAQIGAAIPPSVVSSIMDCIKEST